MNGWSVIEYLKHHTIWLKCFAKYSEYVRTLHGNTVVFESFYRDSNHRFPISELRCILNIKYISSCRKRLRSNLSLFLSFDRFGVSRVTGTEWRSRQDVSLHYQHHTTPQKPRALTESILKRTVSVSIFNGESDSKTNCFWHSTRHWCVDNHLRAFLHSSRSFHLWLNTF